MQKNNFSTIKLIVSIAALAVLFAFPSAFLTTSAYSLKSSTINAPPVYCPTNACSTNWSGYAVTGSSGSVSDAKGSWSVTSLTCAKHGTSYAAFWVGIDGYSSNTVEQTGILERCSSGKAAYTAWYEFYPNPSVTISGFTVSPGNVITAEVSYSSGLFTTTIVNEKTGQSYSTSAAVSGAARSSAEWIVERPETCFAIFCSLTTLANYGTAYFGNDYTSVSGTNYATVNGASGPISSFSYVAITMVSNNGGVLSEPSALTSDGTSFTTTYF